MTAIAAHRRTFRLVLVIAASGSVGVGAVIRDAKPNLGGNIDPVGAAELRAPHVEKIAHRCPPCFGSWLHLLMQPWPSPRAGCASVKAASHGPGTQRDLRACAQSRLSLWVEAA
jgi:hypothetical protein